MPATDRPTCPTCGSDDWKRGVSRSPVTGCPDEFHDKKRKRVCPSCGSDDPETTFTDDGITTTPDDHSPGNCRHPFHDQPAKPRDHTMDHDRCCNEDTPDTRSPAQVAEDAEREAHEGLDILQGYHATGRDWNCLRQTAEREHASITRAVAAARCDEHRRACRFCREGYRCGRKDDLHRAFEEAK